MRGLGGVGKDWEMAGRWAGRDWEGLGGGLEVVGPFFFIFPLV